MRFDQDYLLYPKARCERECQTGIIDVIALYEDGSLYAQILVHYEHIYEHLYLII